MRLIKNTMIFTLLLSVIFLCMQNCNCARIPLQVDITKMAQCDDSKRAGNGDKVSKNKCNIYYLNTLIFYNSILIIRDLFRYD